MESLHPRQDSDSTSGTSTNGIDFVGHPAERMQELDYWHQSRPFDTHSRSTVDEMGGDETSTTRDTACVDQVAARNA
jgi:hypothetical protein